MRGIIGMSRVAADRTMSLCGRAAQSSDRISSGGHCCTKGGKLADVEVWQGRRGWRAGILYHCHIVQGSNLRSIQLFFFPAFLFPPHGLWARCLATSLFLHTQSFPFASTVSLVMYTSSWLAVFLCFYETARRACI